MQDDTKPEHRAKHRVFRSLKTKLDIMPLSAEAQREEKIIAKQAATDEKVRDPRLVLYEAAQFILHHRISCML